MSEDTFGSIDSWESQVDICLGQANRVLRKATDDFIAGISVDSEACVCLAEAWRSLADHWAARQLHELALSDAIDGLETEPEDEPEPRRRQRAR